jgi:hypothetical protein
MARENTRARQMIDQHAAHAAYVAARADFTRSLQRVYQDPQRALQQFETTLRAHGTNQAVEVLYRAPTTYGPLNTETEKTWGGLFRRQHDAQAREAAHDAAIVALTMQTKNSQAFDAARPPHAMHAADERVLAATHALASLPSKTSLDQRIGQAVSTLTATEFKQLTQRLTDSQRALVSSFKMTIREAVLGRDERER